MGRQQGNHTSHRDASAHRDCDNTGNLELLDAEATPRGGRRATRGVACRQAGRSEGGAGEEEASYPGSFGPWCEFLTLGLLAFIVSRCSYPSLCTSRRLHLNVNALEAVFEERFPP